MPQSMRKMLEMVIESGVFDYEERC
jgi:hypothetical protein